MKVAASVLHSGYGELGEIYIPLIYIFVLKKTSLHSVQQLHSVNAILNKCRYENTHIPFRFI